MNEDQVDLKRKRRRIEDKIRKNCNENDLEIIEKIIDHIIEIRKV